MPRAAALSRPVLPLPLLVWDDLRQLGELRAERAALQRRIHILRRHSHRRIHLEFQLAALTAQLIEAEIRLADKGTAS